MKWMIYGAAVLLAFLHQDSWNWDKTDLIFGWLPVGLGYHVLFSILAGTVWALAVKFAWPEHIEAWADEVETGEGDAHD